MSDRYKRHAARGARPLELSEEFRTRAQRCLKLAHEAPTLEAQTHWLAMAQLWFDLAEHSEEQDARFLGRSTSTFHDEDSDSCRSNGEDEDSH